MQDLAYKPFGVASKLAVGGFYFHGYLCICEMPQYFNMIGRICSVVIGDKTMFIEIIAKIRIFLQLFSFAIGSEIRQ